MRRFSEKEKENIRILCEEARDSHAIILPINLLYDTLKKNRVSYTVGADTLAFHWGKEKVEIGRVIAVENSILEVSLLLDYLEKNGLIKYIEDQNTIKGRKPITVGIKAPEHILTVFKTIDPIISEQLSKASTYRVYVGQTLRELVNNNFKTYEDLALDESIKQTAIAGKTLKNSLKTLKKAKDQTRYALLAVIIAIVTPFVTYCVSQCSPQRVVIEDFKPARKESCITKEQQKVAKDKPVIKIDNNTTK